MPRERLYSLKTIENWSNHMNEMNAHEIEDSEIDDRSGNTVALQPATIDLCFQRIIDEIQAHQSASPADIQFQTFREKFGLIKANVKGGNMNEFVRNLQGALSEMNEATNRLYSDALNICAWNSKVSSVLFQKILYSIHEANEANLRADESLSGLNSTVVVLNKFKKRLQENTKHLDDIDAMWEDIQSAISRCERLEINLRKEQQEIESASKEFGWFKKEIKAISHLKDVDRMFTDIDALNSRLKAVRSEFNNAVSELKGNTELLQSFCDELETQAHLHDIDAMFDNIREMEDVIENNQTAVDQSIQSLKADITELQHMRDSLYELQHLMDVDRLWDDTVEHTAQIDNLTRRSDGFDSQLSSLREEATGFQASTDAEIRTLQEFRRTMASYEHLSDIDNEWEFVRNLETAVNDNHYKVTEEIQHSENDIEGLKSRIKTLYYCLGATAAVAIAGFILGLTGVI